MQVDRTEPTRDKRKWEKCSKHGTRLRRQVGTDKYKSTVSENGRERVRHFRAPNWTQARNLHAKRLVNVEEGREPSSSRTTMDELAVDYFDYLGGLVATEERSERTLDKHRGHYRNHLQLSFGRMRVQAIRPAHVSSWLAAKRHQGLDVSSIYATLSVLLNFALSRDLMIESPLKRLAVGERPRQQPKNPPRCPSDEECSKLIEHSLPATKTLNALVAFTGVRQSEALGLIWDDLELPSKGEYGTMRVSLQLKRKKRGEPVRRVPLKTARRRRDAREREVDLLPDLVDLLKRHKVEAFKRGHARPEDYVFATASGNPMYYRNVSRDFGIAADRAGLNDRKDHPRLSMHDLRHATISRWIAQGLDSVTVASMAGDTVEQIHKTYAHEFEKARRKDERHEKLSMTNIVLGG